MGKRRDGREAAIQYLYQLDLNGQRMSVSMRDFWELRVPPNASVAPAPTRAFAEALVAGVQEHQAEVDGRISELSKNFELNRLAAVDRNVLRVAIYEMLYSPELPAAIIINEAIELAKRFGSDDSGRFVNGLLDRLRTTLERSPREPAAPK